MAVLALDPDIAAAADLAWLWLAFDNGVALSQGQTLPEYLAAKPRVYAATEASGRGVRAHAHRAGLPVVGGGL
jgi:hypothetical protein